MAVNRRGIQVKQKRRKNPKFGPESLPIGGAANLRKERKKKKQIAQ